MARHNSLESMIHESMLEMLLTAKYCIEFQKDPNIWSEPGCYGYPAATLLLNIADSIGSYVYQGTVENHFSILNDSEYYNLQLTADELKIIYNKYRNLLNHNSVMAFGVGLEIGNNNDKIFVFHNNTYWLRLVPLYNMSVSAVKKFLDNPEVLKNNQTLINIYRK